MSSTSLFTRLKITLFVLSICALALFGGRTPERTATASEQPLPSLQGAAASEYLKQQGLYPSLSAALSAARYQAQSLPVDNAFQFVNSAQRFRAQFSDGVTRVRATGSAPDCELMIKLTSYGYGKQLIRLVPGGIEAHQNRIEREHHPQLTQSAIGRQQQPQPAIKEWFVNNADGLEHGFVLPAPPPVEHAEMTPLRLELALDGDWEPRLDAAGQTVALTAEQGAGALSYGHLSVTDATGTAAKQGSAYVFVRSGTTWTQQQKLIASDGAVNDFFGWSVAINSNTIVVGAEADDIGANGDQGSAYVFVLNGATWAQQQKLTASDGKVFSKFGWSVGISGETVIVGAEGDTVGANQSQGSAYVFVRSGMVWTQQQKLTANDGAANDLFGISVAISGDTVIVGATDDTIGANAGQGSAYVFVRSGTVWTQQQKLTASDGTASDSFGYSVAISGDTVVFGADGDNMAQGSAYVFVELSCPALMFTPASLPNGVVGHFYQQIVSASGGVGPYQYSFSGGSLPTGLTFSNTGLLIGTPTTLGTFNFTITATAPNLCPGSQTYTVNITASCPSIAITPTSLPDGAVGFPYNQSLTAAGGTAPYSFSVSAGALPTGVTMSSAGVLSGTPTVVIAFGFIITATDANGCTGTRSYTINITGNPGLMFYPLAHPVRLLETRFGATGCYQPNAALFANQIYVQPARGACGGVTIAANALGIVGNATVVLPWGNGYLTLWPSDEAQVFVASSNFAAGAIFNRHFTVGLGNGDGAFKILSSAMTDLVIDVSGYFAP